MKKRKVESLLNRCNWKETCRYLEYCADLRQNTRQTLKVYRSSLNVLLMWAQDLRLPQADTLRPTFTQYLAGNGYSPAYIRKVLGSSRDFFKWAMMTIPAYRKVHQDWILSLRAPKAKSGKINEHELFTLGDVMTMVNLEARNLGEQRDRAAVAFMFLSGIRGGAFATLPIEAVHIERQPIMVRQWPDLGVRTKNSKPGNTFLLRHSELNDLDRIVRDWHALASKQLGPHGMWYALIEPNGNEFSPQQAPGEHRKCLLTQRIKALCERAGFPARSSHKLRHGHAVWALKHCATIADLKAVSQNLMHTSLTTTDSIYGILDDQDVAQRIAQLGTTDPSEMDTAAFMKRLKALLKAQESETAEGDDLENLTPSAVGAAPTY